MQGKTRGHFREVLADGTVRTGETFTCCHCNTVVVIDPKAQSHICAHCMAPVCGAPRCMTECKPFEKKLEEYERSMARQASRASLFRAVGIK